MTAQEGDLRVWWIPQMPMEPLLIKVTNPDEGAKLLDILADYDLFLHDRRIRKDCSNAGGLEVYEDGEWVEWLDEAGYDVGDIERESPVVEWRKA